MAILSGRLMGSVALVVCLLLQLSSCAFVGNLVRNKLVLELNGRVQELQLDVNAHVSTLSCTHPPQEPVFGVKLTINRTDGSNPTGLATLKNVKFSCAGSHPPAAALGVSNLSLTSQLSPKKKIFTYCLSATTSNIFFGAEDINFMPNKRPISPLLQYTPLHLPAQQQHGASPSYHIKLDSIKFNGSSLPVKPLTVGLSASEPYTRLVRPAYVALRDAFRRLTIQRVPPVAPFDTCFNASGLGSTRVGPSVPQVELQLAGNTTWTLFGANTIVFLNNSAACLAFVDAGPPPATSVIGQFQQLDNLIRYDLEKRRFGFTGVLYFFQTTCSNFNSTLA